jgi:hypothetical protein
MGSDRKLEGIAVCYGEWLVVDSLIIVLFQFVTDGQKLGEY